MPSKGLRQYPVSGLPGELRHAEGREAVGVDLGGRVLIGQADAAAAAVAELEAQVAGRVLAVIATQRLV